MNKWIAAPVALGLVACDPSADSDDAGNSALCQLAVTPITEIQGQQYQSPLDGQAATAAGVVTRIEPGAGVYIEDVSEPFGHDQSRALFLADAQLAADTSPGQRVIASGQVAELGNARDTLTSLSNIEQWSQCGEAAELPLTPIELPIKPRRREALEGMRIGAGAGLSVTDVYKLDEGRIRLSQEGPLSVPTDIVKPGRSSARQFSRNLDRSIEVSLPERPDVAIAVGAVSGEAAGVLGHDGRYPLWHVGPLEFRNPEPSPAPAHPGGNTLRVVNANLENFFNGEGEAHRFPAERGPETQAEFEAKSARIQAALGQLHPDLLTVQELENDGFDEPGAASDLIRLLENATGVPWDVITTGDGKVGDDVIAVGLFYRPDRLEPQGPAHVLQAAAFSGLSRHPLAQMFKDKNSGENFWVSVNHLKSKGRCPEDGPDASQKDGQGCWNQARVAAVEVLLPWLENLATESGSSHLLITGDMNAWRKEDPIRAFLSAGLTDLVLKFAGRDSYSYVYRGERGSLDYALGSESLVEKVINAQTWNINAAWPRKVELQPAWLRYSDHDPVVVDLDFSQSATSR